MPTSYVLFKDEIKDYFIKNIPTSMRVLDVGPGCGTYSNLIRSLGYNMDAVEIFEPYVEKYKLREKYDNVYIDDITKFDYSDYDFIILGDVLEHLDSGNATTLISTIKDLGKQCLVAVPYLMEQEEYEDNMYETHIQYDLTPEIMNKRYPELILLYGNELYGYYIIPDTRVEKAFVLYATDSYADTVQGCVDSIRSFSDLPIYVYMLNSDIEIYNAITIKWKCNTINPFQKSFIDRSDLDIYKILIQRPLIVKDVLERYTNTVAYIDADSVATKYIDNIFSYFSKESEYPYFTASVYDFLIINGRGGASDYDNLDTTLEAPVCKLFKSDQKERKSTGYRQTGYFVAGQRCIDFLDIWGYRCQHPLILKNNFYYCPFNEETVLQTMLYDYKAYNGLPLVYCNGLLNYKIEYKGYPYMVKEWLKIPARESEHLFFHGEKNINKINEFIEYLQNKRWQ